MQAMDQSVHEGKPVKEPNYILTLTNGVPITYKAWVDPQDGAIYLDGVKWGRTLSSIEKDSLWNVEPIVDTRSKEDKKVTGGPSSYYDLPFKDWVTTNDMVEYFSIHSWKEYSAHMKEILKAIVRWGNKDGTTKEYDSKKIIYYGARILRMVSGSKVLREYLQELLDNPQFK